jgi:hypothetical protein
VFELTTFHPFHFSAQVKDKEGNTIPASPYAGDYGRVQPSVDNVLLSYEPGQKVDVEFDVTSFKSNMQDVSDADQVSVDPFGTAFEIYIDAPTLKLDESAVAAAGLSDKIKKSSTVPGRVIYTVEADREEERIKGNFSIAALAADTATKDAVNKETITVNQEGERKSIPFKTKSIVSAGDITVSSDEDVVVYYKKIIKIQNKSIVGKLRFREGGIVVKDVPIGSFVPFEVLPSYNRIGTVAVEQADGTFELRLRSEYEYSWSTGRVKFQYTSEGKIYEKIFTSLSNLYDTLLTNDTIILELQ